ncbi:MAG: transglycosylase domain-containing protein [Pseudomonadota bacterium]
MKQSYVRALAAIGTAVVALAGLLGLAVLATYYYLAPTLPDVATLRDVRLQVPLRVYSRDGRLLAQIGEQRRIPVAFDDVPERMVQAFLAAEDDRFFEHGGIDLAGLSRIVVYAGQRGGGSTITMQLARNMFLTPERQLRRKLREIFLAIRIEREFTKQEILALYLNKIFLGQRAYGVAAAAAVYFGKPRSALTLPEIATIAGTTQLPSVLNPIANPERAKQRRGYVLRRMEQKGFITAAERAEADAAPMVSREHGPRVEVDAPYVAEMVRAQRDEQYGDELHTAGYRVTTTVDSRLQHAADWALRAALIEYDRRHGWRGAVAQVGGEPGAIDRELARRPVVGGLLPAVVTRVEERAVRVRARGGREFTLPWETGLAWARRTDARGNLQPSPKTAAEIVAVGDLVHVLPVQADTAYLAQVPVVQGAFVALDPVDGAVTALTGGFDFYQSKFNRAVQARRQPGSAFKPFVYSGALEQGFTPASVILDAPVVVVGGSREETWRPENDSGRFYGPTRLRDALARSRNLVSIRLLRSIGVDYAVDYASRFGFPRETLPRTLTLALGTGEVTPLALTAGYAVFANGGFRVEPYVVERVEDATGKVLYQATPRIACRECAEQAGVALAAGGAVPGDAQGGAAPGADPAPGDGTAPGDAVAVDADGAIQAAAPGAVGATGSGPNAAPVADVGPIASPGAAPVVAAEAIPAPFTAGANEPGVTRLADVGADARLAPPLLAPQVISAANAFLTADLMRDVVRRGTATRLNTLRRGALAGQTGTTNEMRDAWFAGFNGEIVAGAWVGFDEVRSLGRGEEGGRTALPVWLYFMSEALAGRPSRRLPQPPGIVTARISPATGQLASAGDPDAVFELFLADRLPGGGGVAGDGASAAQAAQEQTAEDPIF